MVIQDAACHSVRWEIGVKALGEHPPPDQENAVSVSRKRCCWCIRGVKKADAVKSFGGLPPLYRLTGESSQGEGGL